MDRLGFGWGELHPRDPRLVMCAITGYARRSAWAHRSGHDINFVAMALCEQVQLVFRSERLAH